MFQNDPIKQNYNVEVGIFSFKNMKNGFLPFTFKIGSGKNAINETFITPEFLDNFTEELVILVQEILNPVISFKEIIK